MQANPADIEALNDSIIDWNKNNIGDIRNRITALGIKHYKRSPNKVPLKRALTTRAYKKVDLINRLRYKMPRSGVFVHKGVGKGRPITNPGKAKEWFNPVVDENLDDLAERVADGSGNLIINNINIK